MLEGQALVRYFRDSKAECRKNRAIEPPIH